MSKMADQAELGSQLRLQVDELATAFLLNGPDTQLEKNLQQLTQLAAQGDFSAVLETAGRLAQAITTREPKEAEAILRVGIGQLQELLTSSESTAASATASAAPQSGAMNSLAQDPELVGDFVTEAREHLSSVESNMLRLEQNPEQLEAVHAVFRGFHTIKGLAGFLEFMPIRDVAHEVETLLDLARNGKISVSGAVVDIVLESVDYLKGAIQTVELSLNGGTDALSADEALIVRIQACINGDPAAGLSSENELSEPDFPLADVVVDTAPALSKLAEVVAQSQEPVSEPARITPPEAQPKDPVAKESAQKDGATKVAKNAEAASVRVQTAKLDYLMDMVGEMVITQSLIRHNPSLGSIQNTKLMAHLSQLARITSEVQRTTMGMRMINIGQVFSRSSRLVRDLSRKAGKQIQLELSGEETELDKTIAEELSDPLLHMVRNSCDHGIEDPQVRIAAGKDPVARIKLAAYHEGGQIVVAISDDGRGLDREKILAKAIQKGLVEPGATLSEQEIFNLIFEPGFSTAAQITDISGRGVGMDVVRKNIQKLRGRIDIQSKIGQGTTFLLKLPLTLAIIEGLVVAVGPHRYILPIYAVRELISPKPGSISTVHGRNEMAMVRDHVLPVLRLARRFQVQPKSEEASESILIVTECQEQVFCLLVDEVLGKQEVVIKSLGETLKNIPGIAGGAILGDGRVGLILDLDGLFRTGKS